MLIAYGIRCTLALSLILASIMTCAAAEPTFDKRIVQSSYFTQLVGPEHWDPTSPLPQDIDEQFQSLCGTGFDVNRFRAANLANNRHFAESIKEWSAVIERLRSAHVAFDEDEASALIERARLYKHIGIESQALIDIQEASRLKQLNEETRLRLALLSIDLGENNLAEELLSEGGDLANSHDKPIYKYVYGVAQGKNGKVAAAASSFMEAAKLFAIDGSTPCAQACLDAAFALSKDSRHPEIKLRDLTPPKSNSKAILHLLKALATRKDIFENGVLEELLSANGKESGGKEQSLPKEQSTHHFSEIPKPIIEKLANNGMRISMYLRPEVCVVSSDELKHVLGEPLRAYDERHTEYRGSKVYRVPAGLLVLVSREGGFNAIWLAQVYSPNTVYPQPRKPISFFTAEYLKDPFFKTSLSRAGKKGLETYASLVEETLKKDPTNIQALRYKAEIAAKQHNIDQALTAINQAIKLQSTLPKNVTGISGDTGNPLLIDKGNFLLEQNKFAEALTIFKQAYPKAPEADQLYQRAKAEIGVGQYESARKDLTRAADRYFFFGRITRRDEALKLLAEIGTKESGKNATAVSTAVSTVSEILESERSAAKELREQVNAASRLKNAETLHRQQKSINEKCKNVLIAMSKRASKPLKLTDALVDFARTATEMEQLSAARALLDRAIQAYCTYAPLSEYDGCTVSLIKQLEIFSDEQIGERLRTVATRSEPFCDDGNFGSNRDHAFNDLIQQYGEDQQIVLLRTMIDIRKTQSKNPKITSKIWQDRLNYIESERTKYPTNFLRPTSLSARDRKLSNRSIPGISEQFDASLNAISELERQMHRLYRNSERNTNLTTDWKHFVLDLNCEQALKQMLQFAGDLAIANVYLQTSASNLAADSIRDAVNNLVDTDLDCLIDSLANLRIAAELNNDFVLAELAYDHAIERLATAQTIRPEAMLELKLSFAELLMNHQRTLSGQKNATEYREKAAKLFNECESNRFDNELLPENCSRAKMAVRRLIAMKYPALQRLDLPHGEILYIEMDRNKEVENYIEISDRGIIGRGSNELTLGHTIEILVNGRTLDEKSFEQLDAGHLSEAEKILIAALRAKPKSETFAMLGELWFLKNEKSSALQACLMALDMDSHNALAIALKRIIKGEARTDNNETLILRSTISKNSKVSVLTQALCLVALHNKPLARQTLMQYLRKKPNSYLARQLIQIFS